MSEGQISLSWTFQYAEEAGSTPACLSPSFLASLTPRLTVSYGLTSSRLRNCHISYCAPVLPSWDPYGTSTPERSKHSPCSMTDLSDIPDPGEDRLWSHDIHPTPPFKNDWAYYGIRRPGDRPASPPPGSPFGDRRLAITGRMAEVAKAAEALVDSVIRAAEDAVSQAMQGEGHGAPQRKSSSEPEGAGPSHHTRPHPTPPHTTTHNPIKVDRKTQTSHEILPQEQPQGHASSRSKARVSMNETVEIARVGARSIHRYSSQDAALASATEQMRLSLTQSRFRASVSGGPAPNRASLLRAASSLSGAPSPRPSTTRSASPPRRPSYYYFQKVAELEQACDSGPQFSDRPNPRLVPNPTLPSVPCATWPDPHSHPRFPSPTPAPAPPTPPSAPRPSILCTPPVASDLYKWDVVTPRFAPLPLHRSGPDQTPPPAPRLTNFHKWSLTSPRFASPPAVRLQCTMEPNLTPVPPPLSPHRVRDWAKLPTPHRFRPSYKPLQRPRQPYPNYLHKQRATRQATPTQDPPQQQPPLDDAPPPTIPPPQPPPEPTPTLSAQA